MSGTRTRLPLVFLAVACVLFLSVSAARGQTPRVLVADINDAIDRSTLEYMAEAIAEAQAGRYAALVLRLNTPGGALAETESIASLMQSAPIPILGYVAPVGAHAWSAGTILLEASDVAALAPGATIGSVQPVVIGPTGVEPVTDEKIIQAVEASLRAKIALHAIPDRNESLASEFVRRNLNLNAIQAVELGAAEYVAATLEDFLLMADGDRILIQEGTQVIKDLVLDTADAQIVSYSPSIRVTVLTIFSDPLISSLLLILGIYLLIYGLTAPGHGAEIAGIIVLLLAIIGLGFSVDPIALLLIILGVIFLIVELKTPGFGAFGVGGVVSIVVGAAFLAPLRPPDFIVSPDYQVYFLLALLVPVASVGAFLLFAIYKVLEIRRRRPVIGAMVGEKALTKDPLGPEKSGYVLFEGELWQAVASEEIPAESTVYIRSVEGLLVHVSTHPPAPAPEPAFRRGVRRLFGRKVL